ncbi:NAD(P)H-dependent oxidoreductase subunit E [Candidatus Omnitrophota bacterium]
MAKTRESEKVDVICMLQEIQNKHNYLPKKDLERITKKLNIPLSQTYSLATFYKAFSLKPRGKFLISVCMGTACHVRGAEKILGEIQRTLKIKPGQTSEDQKFTLETVNCLGACALGPLMVVNGEYYGSMNAKKVSAVLKKYIAQKKNAQKS